MNYKDLEIWQLSREVVIELHKMSLELPKFEMYEEGGLSFYSSFRPKGEI